MALVMQYTVDCTVVLSTDHQQLEVIDYQYTFGNA